jgi:hypothetical protein
MARLSREIIVTEKIDGTNAQILITEEGGLFTGSRNRWITAEDDNYGFARWAQTNRQELIAGLGPGRHFGEWWGSGIQRGYGLRNGDKRFSLFNVQRWCLAGETPKLIYNNDPRVEKYQDVLPECCGLVPVIYQGMFDIHWVNRCVELLEKHGSYAVTGYPNPEGIIVYHTAGNVGFKKTIHNDDKPKSRMMTNETVFTRPFPADVCRLQSTEQHTGPESRQRR